MTEKVKPWVHTAHDRNSIHEADFMLFTHGDVVYYQGDLFLGREGVSSIGQMPMLELAKTRVALVLDRKLIEEAGLVIPNHLDFYIREVDAMVSNRAMAWAEKSSAELDS
jgi:hypothetical protein